MAAELAMAMVWESAKATDPDSDLGTMETWVAEKKNLVAAESVARAETIRMMKMIPAGFTNRPKSARDHG